MTAHTRRTVLLSAAVVGGAAVGGAGVAFASRGTSPAAPGAPLPSAGSAAQQEALGTALLAQAGEPVRLQTIPALSFSGVMQDVVLLRGTGVAFVTQKMSGSNGAEQPYETTVVNRVRLADGALLDAMVLVDGGHGLGFEAVAEGDATWLWITWHGASADSAGREHDFVRLRYTPGTWTRGQANAQLGLTVVPLQDRTPEAVYHFDWARDLAVERHFNPPQAPAAPTETYIRRRISDLRAGVDRRLGEVLLRASPPTTQGFATVNGTLFRWLGAAASGGVATAADPIALEQYSWATGRLVATGVYPALWQPWDGGVCEPQGLSVRREDDGAASLILGATTGPPGQRRHQLAVLSRIGAA